MLYSSAKARELGGESETNRPCHATVQSGSSHEAHAPPDQRATLTGGSQPEAVYHRCQAAAIAPSLAAGGATRHPTEGEQVATAVRHGDAEAEDGVVTEQEHGQ
jgi:hypothetical protein